MNHLKEIINKLHSTKPQWSIDIYDPKYESRIKSKYQLETILNESDAVEDWFDELGVDEIQIHTFQKNGTSWKRIGIAVNIDLKNKKPELESIENNIYGLNGTHGLNVPQLIANTSLLDDLRRRYDDLSEKYENDIDKYKLKAQKFKDKHTKSKNKLYLLKLENANTPFLDNETKKELANGLTGLLSGFVNTENPGLNAPDEKLSELQVSFIQFIKQLDDISITKLGELYNSQIEQANTTNQVAQS